MNVVQSKQNYYYSLKDVNFYVDFINNRVEIFDCPAISKAIINEIIIYAKKARLGKIITFCKSNIITPFVESKFKIEGIVSGFFRGEDAYCMSFFVDNKRSLSSLWEKEDIILNSCINNKKNHTAEISDDFIIRDVYVNDLPQIIKLFSVAFNINPTPTLKYEYIKKIIQRNVLFKVALHEDKVVSVASAELDNKNLNAEITDCATYPLYSNKGILSRLINSLEFDLEGKGYNTIYSLSRAINPSINAVFSRLDYIYGGRLINNSSIRGDYEDVNIWVKKINRIH